MKGNYETPGVARFPKGIDPVRYKKFKNLQIHRILSKRISIFNPKHIGNAQVWTRHVHGAFSPGPAGYPTCFKALAGFPAAMCSRGISLLTTEPLPIIQPDPMFAITIAPSPIQV